MKKQLDTKEREYLVICIEIYNEEKGIKEDLTLLSDVELEQRAHKIIVSLKK
ncbi:MAG: hypothetical protein ACYDCN_13510 [Bacteroidia bacterium]